MCILFYTYIPCRYIFSLELCWRCAIGGTWYSALHLWAAGWFQCNGVMAMLCSGWSFRLVVPCTTGCSHLRNLACQFKTWCPSNDVWWFLRTSWRSLSLSRPFHFIKHIQDIKTCLAHFGPVLLRSLPPSLPEANHLWFQTGGLHASMP